MALAFDGGTSSPGSVAQQRRGLLRRGRSQRCVRLLLFKTLRRVGLQELTILDTLSD